MFLSFCGKNPRNEGAAFVAPNATVQGDVIVKPGDTVWYGAVLRGDDGTLTIGENSNVQDNAVLHCDVGFCFSVRTQCFSCTCCDDVLSLCGSFLFPGRTFLRIPVFVACRFSDAVIPSVLFV